MLVKKFKNGNIVAFFALLCILIAIIFFLKNLQSKQNNVVINYDVFQKNTQSYIPVDIFSKNKILSKAPKSDFKIDDNCKSSLNTCGYFVKGNYIYNDRIKVKIRDEDNMIVFNEVFIYGSYSFSSPSNKKYVVFDVGSNVCLASLYFLLKENVDHVYAFEPVKETLEFAKENLRMSNKDISEKISVYDFGLSDKKESIEIKQQPFSGLNSTYNKTMNSANNDFPKITVNLEKASSVFSSIITKCGGKKLILKMDCEGGEHSIFPCLDNAGILKKFDIILFEWHSIEDGNGGDDFSKIENLLFKNNFVILSQGKGPVRVVKASKIPN
ncbi:MAG: FkbM family methyltransferase [Oscillospiraceae bacterium]|nr:FkbM family methyltransferase [Oscillospiraceae bacterium]